MPRRKGHGIPPTKRIKVDNSSLSQNPSDTLQRASFLISNSNSTNDTSLNTNKLKRNNASLISRGSNKDGSGSTDGDNEDKTSRLWNSELQPKRDFAASSDSQINNNNKYLHKKFKKMASTVLSPEETALVEPSFNVAAAPTTMVNGIQRVKGVLCSVPVNDNSNNNASSKDVSSESALTNDMNVKTSVKSSSNDVGTRTESPSGRYKCRYCELPCAKPSVLQKHIRAHTNERPYPCRPCGFAFKTKSNLYKHCRSRSHIRKMEELGMGEAFNDRLGSPLLPDDNAESSNEEEESSSHANSAISATSAVSPEKNIFSITKLSVPSKDKMDDKHQKTIYKPKFRTASIYLDDKSVDSRSAVAQLPLCKEEDNGSLPKQHLNLTLKLPSATGVSTQQPTSTTPQSTPSPFTSGSSPSPEFLQRHITKLISENQAIVETMDPFWPKKFLQRSNSREAPTSPLSPSQTPAPSDVISKKFFHKLVSNTTGGVRELATGPAVFDSRFKQISDQDFSECEKSNENGQSKLALALLRPQIPTSPCHQPMSPALDVSITDAADLQPLNLSINSNKFFNKREYPAVFHSRKRSYSEGFTSKTMAIKCEVDNSEITSESTKSLSNAQFNEELIKLDSSVANNINTNAILLEGLLPSDIKNLDVGNAEGSIIKDLLLKTRTGAGDGVNAAAPYITGALQRQDLAMTVGLNASIDQRSSGSEQRYDAQNPFICQFCNLSFRNMQVLQRHQTYHCKKCISVVAPSHSSSPKHPIVGNKQIITPTETLRSSPAKERWEINTVLPRVITPPFPSPGPLLGKTPLVDNNVYATKNSERLLKNSENDNNNNSKPRKSKSSDNATSSMVISKPSSPLLPTLGVHQRHLYDRPVSSVTLRSLEELSKCPMRSNSLQMFGGEVQILDNLGGETKTLRIEPSNRNSPSEIHVVDIENNGGKNSLKIKESSHSPHIVVTIAKTGLHSGGTIVQVPQSQLRTTTATTTATAGAIMVVGDYQERGANDYVSKEEEISVSHSNTFSSDPRSYCDNNKLIIPVLPNISVPGITPISVPLTPLIAVTANHPGHRQHQHHLLQSPGPNVINPLTSITGYNPLTLPTVSPELINSNNVNINFNNSTSKPSQYGGIVTILHGGKAIPYVPGMPGPQTLINTSPVTVAKLSPSTVTPTTASLESLAAASIYKQSFDRSGSNCSSDNSDSDDKVSTKFSTQIGDEIIEASKASVSSSTVKGLSTTTLELQQISDKNYNSVYTSANTVTTVAKPSTASCKRTSVVSPLPVISIERVNASENHSSEKKFLRPTSLPLKPGTFTPKRHTLNTPNNVLPLVSPETPRPRKSYGQLYLNGHAYTYLGLKCSTRVFFCTLNKPQPIYVPLTPEHSNISMYSNWKVCSDADPNPFGLDPGKAMRYYDSRHRPSCYTIAHNRTQHNQLTVTHSSYWNNNNNINNTPIKQTLTLLGIKSSGETPKPSLKASSPCKFEKEEIFGTENEEHTPKRVKIFAGGFESNEDYIYIRGRGRGRYVCEECGIRCKKPSMLKKHIRTHTDVRPFTCKHCSFSFKTKGNLTKHMKSKAHYKKCIELGLNPVPTLVDDSCINEEMLLKQQAMRADQGLLGNEETDDEEDDEDEDDDEEEEEEDEEEEEEDDGEGGDNWNSNLEREAACSLLSLSEGAVSVAPALSSSPLSLINAGLVAVQPNTYPYSFIYTTSPSHPLQQPQTPTLTAMTAQREREKVLQNTGLARDLSYEEQQLTMCPAQKPAARLESGSDCEITSRYYFPSVQNKLLQQEKKTAAVSSSNKRIPDSQSDELSITSDDFNFGTSNNNVTVSTCSPASSIFTISESSQVDANISASAPIDLSSKSVEDNKNPINNLRSRVQTCEAALLLASLCSTVDSLPPSKRLSSHMINDISCHTTVDDNRSNPLLQAYITERAVKQLTIKQHQSYSNNRNNIHVNTNADMPSINVLHQNHIFKPHVDVVKVTVCSKTTTTVTVAVSSPSLSSSPSLLQTGNSLLQIGVTEDSGSEVLSTNVSLTKVVPNTSSIGDSFINDLPHSVAAAKENALDILAKTSLASDTAKKQALKLSSVTANSLNSTGSSSGSPNKKLKAEFLPPSSGPSPSYVSILEDGRSMCMICNKIFTKPSQMKLHVNIHYFERPFRCESCAVSFRTKGHLQKHQRSVTHMNKMSMNSTFGTATTSNPRPFKCDDCKIAFRIHGHLAKHLRSKMHIMKLECLGKLPFGTYAEMERSGINMNDIDTSDCENSLESLQLLAQKLYEKDPTKLGQWDPNEMLPLSSQLNHRSNTSATGAIVEHHKSPSQNLGNCQQQHQELMIDDMSSNDDEDNDNDESTSKDVNNFSTTIAGSGNTGLIRNRGNLGSASTTGTSCEDDSVTLNKQYLPKVKYHMTTGDSGMVPVILPNQIPVQDIQLSTQQNFLKNKFSDSGDSSFSSNNIKSRISSSNETHFVYLKKATPQVSLLPPSSPSYSSGSVITSVIDYTSNCTSSPNVAVNTNIASSFQETSICDKTVKSMVGRDQSDILSSIKSTKPSVIDVALAVTTVQYYVSNPSISSRNSMVSTTATISPTTPVTLDSLNYGVNSINNNCSNSNRSVIQRLDCNLEQQDQIKNDSYNIFSLSVSKNDCDNSVNKNPDEIYSVLRKTNVSDGEGSCIDNGGEYISNAVEKISNPLNSPIERTEVSADLNVDRQLNLPSAVLSGIKKSESIPLLENKKSSGNMATSVEKFS